MGKMWLKQKFLDLGIESFVRNKQKLLDEAFRRFTVRVDKRFANYPDMDYYGLRHSEETCSFNEFSNRCEGEDIHKKIHKDTFLFEFYEEYKKSLEPFFNRYVKKMEITQGEKLKHNKEVIEENDLEI